MLKPKSHRKTTCARSECKLEQERVKWDILEIVNKCNIVIYMIGHYTILNMNLNLCL